MLFSRRDRLLHTKGNKAATYHPSSDIPFKVSRRDWLQKCAML